MSSNTQVAQPNMDCNNHSTKMGHTVVITPHKCCQLTPKLQPNSDPTNVECSIHNSKVTHHKLLLSKRFQNHSFKSQNGRISSRKSLKNRHIAVKSANDRTQPVERQPNLPKEVAN